MLVRVAAVARNDSSSKCCNSILHRLNLQISVAWGQVIISSRGQVSNLSLIHRHFGKQEFVHGHV